MRATGLTLYSGEAAVSCGNRGRAYAGVTGGRETLETLPRFPANSNLLANW